MAVVKILNRGQNSCRPPTGTFITDITRSTVKPCGFL